MSQVMSTSLIACTIDSTVSAIVRLKTSGGNGYILSACKTLPFGINDFAPGKGMRFLKKLENHLKEWKADELALSIAAKTWLPLPASFPAGATPEEYQKYCRIEAEYFLTKPDQYLCDCTDYGSPEGLHEKHLLLFYPAEPCKTISDFLSVNHRIVFKSSTQLPLLHLSRFAGEPQILLELERNAVIFTITINGRIEKFSCRQVKSREETEYFAIRELVNNPVCREKGVMVSGAMADKAMTTLISKETSIVLKPLRLPASIFIGNSQEFDLSSSAVVKAIGTALTAMAQ